MGLTGGNHWDASILDLNEGEAVTSLARARVRECVSQKVHPVTL